MTTTEPRPPRPASLKGEAELGEVWDGVLPRPKGEVRRGLGEVGQRSTRAPDTPTQKRRSASLAPVEDPAYVIACNSGALGDLLSLAPAGRRGSDRVSRPPAGSATASIRVIVNGVVARRVPGCKYGARAQRRANLQVRRGFGVHGCTRGSIVPGCRSRPMLQVRRRIETPIGRPANPRSAAVTSVRDVRGRCG
jgi:hypothetical protein